MLPNLFIPTELANAPGGEYGPSLVKMIQNQLSHLNIHP